VHLWDPPFCGDIDMRIAKDGTWIHEGKPIRRTAMVKLFASVLKLENDTDYFLVTPVEKVGIQVEDCPFFVAEMEVSGEGHEQILTFKTTTEEAVEAGPEYRLQVDTAEQGEPHPIIHIRSGLNGLINRAVFYRLVEMASEETVAGAVRLGVWSKGMFFPFG
jgi:hypothetical protein